MKLLLKNGANIDERSDNLLYTASHTGNVDIAQILLDAGTDINRKDDTGGTALYVACENRDKMVQLLVTHGANPNIQQCGKFDHALRAACWNEGEGIFGLLLENGAKTDLYGSYYHSALQAACVLGNNPKARMLLLHGADVKLSSWNFGSPLVAACARGMLEIAKILVEAGADLHVTNLIGHSALLKTIYCNHSQLEVVDYLIGLGVDPLQEDKRGCNGLHYAARAKRRDIMRRMCDYGINVNGTDSND